MEFITGNAQTIEHMPNLLARRPFADETVEFLNALSGRLMRHKTYADVVTLGFWCRKAALLGYKKCYDDLELRLGRGVVFHIAPSNVAVNFAYSLAAGLLAGNANIVRLPSKDFEQTSVICEEINRVLESGHEALAPYICMVKYPSASKETTDRLSAICDCRVIWGGDATISEIRRSPLKPRAIEMTFADRHSLLVVDADAYLQMDDKALAARQFYNDTFLSDQNACTAPRIIVWLGKHKQQAKEVFWKHIEELAAKQYEIAPAQAVGKLHAAYKAAAYKPVRFQGGLGARNYRFQVEKLDPDLMDFKHNSGFFFEYDANELNEILPVCNEKCQTLTYIGVSRDDITEFIRTAAPKGIDRVVSVGKSMDFGLVWDGYDLIRTLSRRYVIE